MTLEELKQTLSQGNHALAIYDQDEQLHTYDNKGVRDLYTLLTTEPQVLKGAMVADKVVGKGAAALMIVGGIAELHTHIISEPALIANFIENMKIKNS